MLFPDVKWSVNCHPLLLREPRRASLNVMPCSSPSASHLTPEFEAGIDSGLGKTMGLLCSIWTYSSGVGGTFRKKLCRCNKLRFVVDLEGRMSDVSNSRHESARPHLARSRRR